MDTDQKAYEISYLISATLPEEEAFGVGGKITSLIQESGGFVSRIDEPKKRHLAYPMNKEQWAYVGCTVFSISPEKNSGITAAIRNEPTIMRFLFTEEVKRPVEVRMPRSLRGDGVGFKPQAPLEEDKKKIEELDKQLDEILGESPKAA